MCSSTTDHISAAGPWLKYKGHLSNISENLLITAVNDEGGEVNVAVDSDGQDTIPNIAKRYKAKDQPWMLVVDDVRVFRFFARPSVRLTSSFGPCALCRTTVRARLASMLPFSRVSTVEA